MPCSRWPPWKRRHTIAIAVAASVLSTEETLQLKTLKAGVIARAAALYRVDKVIIYKDKFSSKKDYKLLRLLLEYISTPPYLRKRLFPLLPELRAAGLLPPLRIPLHDIPRRPARNLVMEGLVEECTSGVCRVFLGSYGYGLLRGNSKPGKRILVRIIDEDKLLLERVTDPDFYTGFRVEANPDLPRVLDRYRDHGYTIIGTSKKGECYSREAIQEYEDSKGFLVVFGGPTGSVVDEASPDLYDLVLNTIPMQGTKTVRTEEAIHATLAILNSTLESQRLYNP
ncbi:MAG: hypothetical protein F7C38_04405 [Desulfurococcales archaeon]|nr:hypothetical protein [Desulfurococcales archaeon]